MSIAIAAHNSGTDQPWRVNARRGGLRLVAREPTLRIDGVEVFPIFGGTPPEVDFPALLGVLGYLPDEYIAICTEDKRTAKPFGVEAIVQARDAPGVVEKLADIDIYFGVNPIAEQVLSNGGRGTADDVTRLATLPADLDFKDNGCRDEATAHQIIEGLSAVLGTRPSAVTNSGGGLHVYWPVRDGNVNDDNREQVTVLLKRWGRLVKATAKAHGANADTVFDLPRVLRVPGTFNCKHEPIPVVCHADSGRALALAEIDSKLSEFAVDGETERIAAPKSNPDEWEYGDETCSYVTTMIANWNIDTAEGGRHPWFMSGCVRQECAFRLGCITEADYQHGYDALVNRFVALRAATGETVPPGEIARGYAYGVEKAAAKSDKGAHRELGRHVHGNANAGQQGGKKSQATLLVDLALHEYSLGISPDGKPFAFASSVPHVALDLRGNKLGLRSQLARDYFMQHRAAPSQNSVAAALNVLEGMARTKPSTPLHLRVAGDGNAINVDMADESNRVIEIRSGTWKIVDASSHMFRRTELTASTIEPVRGGDLSELWRFVNVADEDRPVFLAVLVDALIQPDTPKPVTGLQAEHGSAKSSTAKFMVWLTDSSTAELRSPPRDIEQWITAAAGSWMVALDNLSKIPDWLSDAICRAATGDGDVRRQLYTDDGLSVFRFLRPVIITGIDVGGLNPDLADRLVQVQLCAISEDDRKEEEELYAAWDDQRASIFGALLDLAVKVHAKLPTLPRQPLPRMADFARVLICVDEILGTNGMPRYREQLRKGGADSATSDSFIAWLIQKRYNTGEYGQSAAEILQTVDLDYYQARPVDWPRKARTVTTRLRKNAPAMRAMGWTVTNDDGRNEDCIIKWTLRPPKEKRKND